jgi:hypothetical protein
MPKVQPLEPQPAQPLYALRSPKARFDLFARELYELRQRFAELFGETTKASSHAALGALCDLPVPERRREIYYQLSGAPSFWGTLQPQQRNQTVRGIPVIVGHVLCAAARPGNDQLRASSPYRF